MQLLPQYLEAIREHVEPFLEGGGHMTAEQISRAEAKMAEIIKREAVNFYPQHLGSTAHDSVAHAIRFFKPKEKRLSSTFPRVMKKTNFVGRNRRKRGRTEMLRRSNSTFDMERPRR